jgi:hypothetical protein
MCGHSPLLLRPERIVQPLPASKPLPVVDLASRTRFSRSGTASPSGRTMICSPGTLSSSDRRTNRLITPAPSCKTDNRRIIKISLRGRFHLNAFPSTCSLQDAFRAGVENRISHGFPAFCFPRWRSRTALRGKLAATRGEGADAKGTIVGIDFLVCIKCPSRRTA